MHMVAVLNDRVASVIRQFQCSLAPAGRLGPLARSLSGFDTPYGWFPGLAWRAGLGMLLGKCFWNHRYKSTENVRYVSSEFFSHTYKFFVLLK